MQPAGTVLEKGSVCDMGAGSRAFPDGVTARGEPGRHVFIWIVCEVMAGAWLAVEWKGT